MFAEYQQETKCPDFWSVRNCEIISIASALVWECDRPDAWDEKEAEDDLEIFVVNTMGDE